jgi:hypothetical protein
MVNGPVDEDREASLRRDVRFHGVLSAAFMLMAVGAGLVVIDRWLTGSITVSYAVVNAISAIGFLALNGIEARAAIRASHKLSEARRLQNEDFSNEGSLPRDRRR